MKRICLIIIILFIYLSICSKEQESFTEETTNKNSEISDDPINEVNIKVTDEIFEEKCTPPSKSNPFMNFRVFDPPEKPKACNVDLKVVEDLLYQDLPSNQKKVFSDKTLMNKLNTNPVTTVINDQGSFVNYLYPNTSTCKSTGYSCINTDSTKYNNARIEYLDFNLRKSKENYDLLVKK